MDRKKYTAVFNWCRGSKNYRAVFRFRGMELYIRQSTCQLDIGHQEVNPIGQENPDDGNNVRNLQAITLSLSLSSFTHTTYTHIVSQIQFAPIIFK